MPCISSCLPLFSIHAWTVAFRREGRNVERMIASVCCYEGGGVPTDGVGHM